MKLKDLKNIKSVKQIRFIKEDERKFKFGKMRFRSDK